MIEAINRIKTIAETLPDDDPDKMDMLNIEGDYSKLMEWALRKHNEASQFEKSCKELADLYTKRAKSFANKCDKFKDIAGAILDVADERKYQGAAGTIGYRATPPKVVIIDEDKIPDDYKKTSVSVDKIKLKNALKSESIAGAELSNGGEVLAIYK